jgi:hypothetical protein
MNETENDRLKRAVERLMDGQREALDVVRLALEGGGAKGALEDLEDILEGSSEDANTILGVDEGGSVT